MCLEFEATNGFCANRTAPVLSSKALMHGTPPFGYRKHQTHIPLKNASLTLCRIETYYALVVDRVTHFCVLDNQITAPPPPTHITNPLKQVFDRLPNVICISEQYFQPQTTIALNCNTEVTGPLNILHDICEAALQCTNLGAC